MILVTLVNLLDRAAIATIQFEPIFIQPVLSCLGQSALTAISSQANNGLSYVSKGLPFLDISYRWNHTICTLLIWLPSLDVMFLRFTQAVVCANTLLLNSTPLCRYTTYCSSFTHWGTQGLFPVWGYEVWCTYKDVCFHFSWIHIYRSRIAGWYGDSVFNFLRNWRNCFPKWLHNFTFLLVTYYGSNFSISAHLLVSIFLIRAILASVKWYFTVVLISVSPISNDVQHLFMCLLDIQIFSLEKFQIL